MLSDVQLFNLVLVEEIDAICKKYGIEYYLAGGSVIGVLRHKGFIPWDDDMDLYMTRDNWLKFREAFDKEKPKDRVLESSDINPNYPNMIAKYTSTNTTAIYKNLLSGNYAAGVIVDILILDPVPSDEAIQKQHLKNLLLYSEFVNRYYVFSHRFDIDVEFDAALEREAKIGHEELVREYERLVTQYSEEESDTYVLRWGGVPHTFSKDLFGTPKWMPFEGIMLPVPQKAFMYLSQLYGEDWIQLPPLEEERIHEAVFSIAKPYEEFFREFSPQFDEKEYLKAIMGRKRNRIQSGRSYRAVQNRTLDFESERIIMRYEALDRENNLRAMYTEGKFDELQELFSEYFNTQCTSRMLGNKYYGGVYRYFHPKYIAMDSDFVWIAIELMCRTGKLHHPKRVIEACAFACGEVPEKMREQKELIDETISIIDAFEQQQFQDVLARAAAGEAKKPDWINFIKLQILAMQRLGSPDKQAIRDLVAKGRAIAPADGDWSKYEGDTYADEDVARAKELYLEARENTRNGSSLLGIDEFFAKVEPDLDARSHTAEDAEDAGDARATEDDLNDVQRVHLRLMREIKDICDAAGIRYYLSNRAALNAYVLGSVTTEETSPTILIHVEDSLKFAEAFEAKGIPNRVLDSMLTNNKYPTFSFRYVDTQTLCLSTRQLDNYLCHGLYVHIGFLERVPNLVLKRFGSMLKMGWFDVNSVNARGSSIQIKSRLSQGIVGSVFNTEKDAFVGSRLFNTLLKIYSNPSNEYQVNDNALKLVKFESDMIDGKQEVVDVCGTEFTTFCETENYLKNTYGRHFDSAARKPKQLSIYRIVDAHIPYEEYCRTNPELVGDQDYRSDVFENRIFFATNRKFMKVIDHEWNNALYIGTKWEFQDYYPQEMANIERLFTAGDYEELADLLLPYVSHFNSDRDGILPYYNYHLLDICEVFLYDTERFNRLERMVERRAELESKGIK